jgi:hypothetical protein
LIKIEVTMTNNAEFAPDLVLFTPSVTTTVINTLILRLGGFDEDDVTVDDTGLSDHMTITMDMSRYSSSAASGGAGYTHQLETGNTGSEHFELRDNLKEQYRTVTLAIAPVPTVIEE